MKKKFTKNMKIGIVGAGQFGFYIAWYLGNNGFEDVFVYDSEKKVMINLQETRKHPKFPVLLPDSVNLASSLEECVSDSEIVFVAVPAQLMRKAVRDFREYLNEEVTLINVAKALELNTNKRMDEVFAEELNGLSYDVAAIAGGMLAKEGVLGHRLSADVACKDIRLARRLRILLGSDTLRLKHTSDIVGVELAGALKNIYAIGVGIYKGISERLGIGEKRISSESALISESAGEGYDLAGKYIEEKNKAGENIRIHPATFAPRSQAWLADLITTCRGGRNGEFGKKVGEGISPKKAKDLTGTVEGYATTRVFYDILGEDMNKYPIFREIYLVLYEGKDPIKGMGDLMRIPHINRGA